MGVKQMKSLNSRYQYYVEGKCEKKLVRTLIDHHLIFPGQTDVLNPVQEFIKPTHLRMLPSKTTIILIFDTDIPETGTLQKNLNFLKSRPNVRRIITIPQIRNLEEELIRSTDVRHIRDLIGCTHDSSFKTAFIEEKRLFDKLQLHHFDIEKLWSRPPEEPFKIMGIENHAELIKM